jgi:hypothetical protein
MVGITLTPEQIKSAPPEVRNWLEHEIAASLGFGRTDKLASPPQLATCTLQEAEAVYASVSGMFPVVNVFLELGREGASIVQGSLEAFRLVDMLGHTRLPDMQHLLACLEFIDQAFREIRKDVDACLFALNRGGYCIVAAGTRRNILSLWARLIATQQIARREDAGDANAAFTHPFSTSGTLPPSSIHLDGAFPDDDVSDQPAFGQGVVQK